MRAISITVDVKFRLKMLIINKSNDIHHRSISLDFIPGFWPIFLDFQNEVAGFCFNSSNNKDVN